MKQKINVRLIGIAILAVLATLVCMTCVYYSLFQKQVRKDLKIQAQMLGEAEVFDDVSTPAKSFDIAKEDLRITWIDKDGTVLYDNDANTDKLENHADRPEVKSAFLFDRFHRILNRYDVLCFFCFDLDIKFFLIHINIYRNIRFSTLRIHKSVLRSQKS